MKKDQQTMGANEQLSNTTLVEFARLLNQQSDFKEALRMVTHKLAGLLNAKHASVIMLNPETRDTIKTMLRGGETISNSNLSSLQRQVTGWMLSHSEGFITEDIRKDIRFRDPAFKQLDIKSVIATLLMAEGAIIGSIILLGKNDDCVFTDVELGFLTDAAIIASPYLRCADQIQLHEKGAFTGANQKRRGLIEEANGGTLFMDEIASLPVAMQSKLMRVLQENEVRPLGSNKVRSVNVRIVSASSRPLRDLVSQELFREDLFYRLQVYPIYVPSLRERIADISILANHFLKRVRAEQKKQVTLFHERVLDFMKHLPWKGNIRELENFVERLVTLAPQSTTRIDPSLIPPDLGSAYRTFEDSHAQRLRPLNEQLRECEERIIRDALNATGWHQAKAAHQLHMSEQNLRYRLKKLGIQRPK